MIESTTDCGHLCCPERQMPFHDHFLSPDQCPTCAVHQARLAGIEAAGADLRQKLAAAQPPGLPADVCSHCKAETPDQVGLSLIETDELEADDFGFCGIPCLAAFVNDRYLVPAASSPSVVGPPSMAAGGDTGATRKPVGSGKSSVAPGRSTSEGLEWAWP